MGNRWPFLDRQRILVVWLLEEHDHHRSLEMRISRPRRGRSKGLMRRRIGLW